MSDFAYAPSWSAKKNTKPRVKVSSFDDGYEQRVGEGINNKPQKWDLTFAVRTASEAAAIEAFFEAKDAKLSFTWTNLDGVEIRVVCREWNRDYTALNVNSITATFEQVFE